MEESQVREMLIDYIIRHEPVTLVCAEELKGKLQEMTTPQLVALFRERDLVEYCIWKKCCIGDGDTVRLL